MDLGKIENELKPFLEKEGLKLFELSYQKKDSILQVMLDEKMDLDALSKVSEKVSEFMDKIDQEFDEYMLDVTTVGAEKPIRNEQEVIEAIGSYVHVKTKELSLDGDLKAYSEGVLTLSYKDKTRVKQAQINYKDVKKIRYAVKF